jgi:hypothetical protein
MALQPPIIPLAKLDQQLMELILISVQLIQPKFRLELSLSALQNSPFGALKTMPAKNALKLLQFSTQQANNAKNVQMELSGTPFQTVALQLLQHNPQPKQILHAWPLKSII